MYKSVFCAYDEAGNQSHLHVSLGSSTVKDLISNQSNHSIGALLDSQATACQLSWSSAISGYVVWYKGVQVGLILRDELLRALSVPTVFLEGSVGCQFAIEFAGATVWRAGLFNESLGQAIVMTADETLSYLPASLWLPVAGGECKIMGLAVGNVLDVFSLTQQQLQWLINSRRESASGHTITGDSLLDTDADNLIALTEASIEFVVSCSGYRGTNSIK